MENVLVLFLVRFLLFWLLSSLLLSCLAVSPSTIIVSSREEDKPESSWDSYSNKVLQIQSNNKRSNETFLKQKTNFNFSLKYFKDFMLEVL